MQSTQSAKRFAERSAGRLCAEKAMFRLCQRPMRLEEYEKYPRWPQGLTGSITHSNGFARALVTQSDGYRSVGIDSERCISARRAQILSSRILSKWEQASWQEFSDLKFEDFLVMAFSMKESVFKTLNPVTGQYFGFHAAEIFGSEPASGLCRIRLNKNLGGEFAEGFQLEGHYVFRGDMVHTEVGLSNAIDS